MTYDLSHNLKSEDLATAPSKVEAGLRRVGIGILTNINIQAAKKIG
ncbi:hypothetical protein [Lunatimonas salinarum]|nr:hypothetical protein [Lunatimonas salinarum]